MWRHSARWSLFSCLLVVYVIRFTSATLVDSQNSDFSHKPNGTFELPDLVQVDRSDPSSNQTNPVFASQHNPTNTTDSLTSDPFNPNRLKKRWSTDYGTSQAERRTFYPIKAHRPQPNNGLPFKGYRPPKAPHIGYPAARPPYQPQPIRPTPPPHNYGVPKPTGYPASNYNQQEIYITYPPATTIRYPQTPGNNNLGGSYGPVITPSYVTTIPVTNVGYRPPKPMPPYVPSQPIYEIPTSYPNPSYVTNKPDYYVPSTTPAPYITPNPLYPLPLDQGVYPGYPVSPSGSGSYNPGSGYPSPSLGTTDLHQPHYPVPPSSGYPSYPASSGGSYHESGPVGSPPPIFVFIPKPGYYNTHYSNSKPGHYHKPSGTYPVHYHSTPRPSGISNGQYYPAPIPIKPPKPISVYPPAKAPSTAYGLPKPQRPPQHHQTSSYSGKVGAGTTPPNYNSARYPIENQLNIQPSYDNNKGGILATQLHQLTTPSTFQSITPAQPSVFQRGNISPRPANSQALHSTVIHDFIALPDKSGEQFDGFNRQNKSWLFSAESSQVLAVTEFPSIGHLPYYPDEFRIPFQSANNRPIKNDCGGSWIVLNRPTSKNVDPTQVQVEPIYLSAQEAPNSGFSSLNSQFFRSPKEADNSIPTLPPKVNELSVVDTSTAYESYVPDFLIFATTPYPELPSTTTERIWRKPNSLTSSVSFFPSPSIPDDLVTSSEQRSSSSGITIIIPESNDPVKTLTSTENSIILSLNANNLQDDNSDEIEQGKRNSPSPFLATVFSSINKENDDDDGESAVNETTDNNLGTNADASSTEDSLTRHLRSANLRVLSSLINQADIASLFQDKEYTLMAPSNAAFNKISAGQRRRWITRPDSLREVLLNHVIPNHLNSSSFENEATHVTLAGSHRLRFNIYNATENRDTVTTVNGARFLTNDLRIGKLLVHIVDRVLMPSPTPSQTILDILNDGGRFQSLQASLLGPALTRVLSSDSPLSVFVPTTEAFLSISQDEQRLFLNNETAFHNLLWYHIVPGTYYSEGLEAGQWLSTLHGVGRLRVELTRQNRKSKLERINGEANVIESDVSATNGVVHFIDRILTDILF
ncbi:uncharacterized protein LOC130691192 isoform X2 [Daphnia carinata]|uniref:uncharacterized protein LOC130691192 isoform X2 n=1 Tax=Daphnia carinata TaxID=120202 RepID=UPI002579B313|nr:uncharacterized protein LOC130691192 isoform X2 [Daphnia carinata]